MENTMSETTGKGPTPVPLWRARMTQPGRVGDAVAEAVGTPDAVGAALTRHLDSIDSEGAAAGHAAAEGPVVQFDVEPHAGGVPPGGLSTLPRADLARRWEATAVVGNVRGVFDAAYSFGNSAGDEGHLVGTARELGDELARVLRGLTADDVEVMKSGTTRFFLRLLIERPRPE
jgi:hypothetical protein